MTTARRVLVLASAAAGLALLAGCTGAADPADGSGGTGGGADSGGCAAFAGTDSAPFRSDQVLSAPDAGATYGDGSAITFELDPALADEVPQLTFYDIFTGGVRDAGPAVLTEEPDNTFTADLDIVNSDLDGEPGIAELFIISDVDYGDARRNGDKLVLGNFCLTYAVAP